MTLLIRPPLATILTQRLRSCRTKRWYLYGQTKLFAWVYALKNDEITRLVEQGLARNFSPSPGRGTG